MLHRDLLARHYSRTYDFANEITGVILQMFNLLDSDDSGYYYYDEYGETLTVAEARQRYFDNRGYGYYIRAGEKFLTNLGITSASELGAPDREEWGYMLKLQDGLYSGYSPEIYFPELDAGRIGRISYEHTDELRPYCLPAAESERNIDMLNEDVEFILLIPPAHENGLRSLFTAGNNVADRSYRQWLQKRIMAAGWCLIVLLGAALLLIAVLRRRDVALFNQKVARLQARIVIELKAAVFLLLVYLLAATIFGGWLTAYTASTLAKLAALGFFAVWLAFCDLKYNGRQSFAFNLVNILVNYFKNRDGMLPPQKRMMRVVRRTFISGCLLCGIGGLLAFLGGMAYERSLLAFGLVLAYAGVVVLCLGVDRYRSIAIDIGEIYAQTQAIRSGELSVAPSRVHSGDLKALADNINCIQDGMRTALERQLTSERMKVELITNVSHDLKTPLTAITNYVGLLDMEQLEPAEANDYVDILGQKTARLTTLISDLFEVSKATSGAMELQMESIDLLALTEQTLAELEERRAASGVTVKMTHPDGKPWVLADGRRLFRVFENVIGNAIKYALPGTRIYVDIGRGSELTSVTVRNIANYEMDFDPQEMLERFVRADKSRTAEGSGLGLSIAKSFTELMGGRLNVAADGDVFKVTLVFRSSEPPVSGDACAAQ